jgi:hypothetical protein
MDSSGAGQASTTMKQRGGTPSLRSILTLGPFVPRMLKDDISHNDERYERFDQVLPC